jgi:hypothetical protein
LQHLLSVIPETMLLYGSNAPFPASSGPALDVMPAGLRERVAHLNAETTFGARIGSA